MIDYTILYFSLARPQIVHITYGLAEPVSQRQYKNNSFQIS